MKILKFEHTENNSIREDMIDTLKNSSSCILINRVTKDDNVSFEFDFINFTNEQGVAACELVKNYFLAELT